VAGQYHRADVEASAQLPADHTLALSASKLPLGIVSMSNSSAT
jgi:hypothetical protein